MDEQWLARAIDAAVHNVTEGGGPFGAVVTRGDRLVAVGVNRVTADLDPTAHAEVMAIRAACRAEQDFSLAGTTLYASCEPCPLCLAASLWARVDRIVFAASRHDAAAAGFDDARFHAALEAVPEAWADHLVAAGHPRAKEPFEAWLAHGSRTPY